MKRRNYIELCRATSPAGFAIWLVCFNDLYFGPRQLASFYAKPEAVAASKRLAREKRVAFGRRAPREPKRRPPTKFELYQQRQRRIAQRAARRARKGMVR
jgi:hypothetical protein